MLDKFDINKFKPFKTSSGLDGNYTGLYDEKIVRLIKSNRELYKRIINLKSKFINLINSEIIFENKNILLVEHEKLTNITYYTEWTKKQKVSAAKVVIELQSQLAKDNFYLNDPHSFNITFKYHQPIYFDLGSIREGRIKPTWWFIKCFCGWTEKDYWDSVLKINWLQKLWIVLKISLSRDPYTYLHKKISKFERSPVEKKIIEIIRTKNIVGRVARKMVTALPQIFRNLSNWSDYDQKSPSLNFDNDRNKNLLEIFRKFKPKKVLDIGANRGAYSLLALDNNSSEVIAIDLDNLSLDYLIDTIKEKGLSITTAKLNIMDYPAKPGFYGSYLPAHERLNSDFAICLAVVHHVCYFGNSSFTEFAERLNRFCHNILIIEFVPYNDVHLTGSTYKGKDRSWYTEENFIKEFKKFFPGDHEIFASTPNPRILIKFTK